MDLALHFRCAYRLQEKASSYSFAMGRSKKGSVCCKKQSDRGTSNQEEIISLLKRIQTSISKGESQEAEDKPLTKAILDVLERSREKTEVDKLQVTKNYKAIEETTEKEEKPPLIETMKLAELKEVAKKRGIKGYSKLKKSELLEILR